MALEYEGVSPDSPAGPDTAPPLPADPSSAGTQNTDQQDQPIPGNRGDYIPRERANEMRDRAVERAVAAAEQRFAQQAAADRAQLQQFFSQQSQHSQQSLLAGLRERATRPSRTPEEERQRQQANAAFDDLMSDNPNWQRTQNFAKAGPAIAQALLRQSEDAKAQATRVAQLEARLAQAHGASEEQRLRQFATDAGLPVATPEQFHALNQQVERIIRRDPQAVADFQSGDAGVLAWAFQIALQERRAQQQTLRAELAQTKSATRALPPRLGGGVPGAVTPSLPKFNPDDPGARERAMFANARGFLKERLAQG